jgi:small-conductance mechanosensitive channel
MVTTAYGAGEVAATNALPIRDAPVLAEPRDEPAAVEVFNRPVALLRATSFGYTPSQRAKLIGERIAAILDKKIYGPVELDRRTEGIAITIGGELAMGIAPGDIDPLAGMTLEETAREAAGQLQGALAQARLQRSTPYFLKAVAKALAATLVFIAFLLLLLALRRRLLPHIRSLELRLAKQISRRGLVFLTQLVRSLRWLFLLTFWFVIVGITTEWASVCLRSFPYTRPWGDRLQANLWTVLRGGFSTLLEALPNLLVVLVILLLARGVVGLLRGFFQGVETGKVKTDWMDIEAARATRRILTIIVWLIALVMVYPYIPGSSSNAFKGMSVFVGLLLSLGSSSVVGQFTSGLVLMYSRALKPGEYVRIGEYEGTVESLGFLSTKIRSIKNEEFHVPNTVILGSTVKNYSRLADQCGLLVHTTVTIGYDAPWRQVHALLIRAAQSTPGISAEPSPFVLQTALSDFYVEYQINAGLAKPQDRVEVLAALHASIQDQFNAHGVQIMSPHYLQDKARPAIVPKDKWYAPPAAPGQQPPSRE